ncbi:MAG: ribonuclease HII [Candidatus Staskawiczbacteria bacterium]|nr:ribonuclease HII [Candidatus Staskawiczbacteria bacterium]
MKPDLKEEKKLWKQGFKCVVGLDEAGRGPLAGPVVAAAVSIEPNCKILFEGINDSKKLSEKQRDFFYKKLIKNKNIPLGAQVKWGIGIVPEKIIDKINILQATKLAMQKAVEKLEPDYLLLDGNFTINSIVRQKPVVRGDQKVISISCASIIAKVTRDKIMKKMHKKYPQYGFDKHKGYGTELHIKMLKKFGACPIHRKSFRLVYW